MGTSVVCMCTDMGSLSAMGKTVGGVGAGRTLNAKQPGILIQSELLFSKSSCVAPPPSLVVVMVQARELGSRPFYCSDPSRACG